VRVVRGWLQIVAADAGGGEGFFNGLLRENTEARHSAGSKVLAPRPCQRASLRKHTKDQGSTTILMRAQQYQNPIYSTYRIQFFIQHGDVMKNVQTLSKALALTCFILGIGASAAAEFPERPISIVTPFTAGSAPDVYTRALATELSNAAG